MDKTRKREMRFIKVPFSVITEGVFKRFYIGRASLLSVPLVRQKGLPRYNIAGEDYINEFLRGNLDSRVDPEKLAERLYKNCKDYPPGFYCYRYGILDD